MTFNPKTAMAAMAAVILSFAVSGCETYDGWNERPSTSSTTKASTPHTSEEQISQKMEGMSAQPAPQFPVPQDRDLKIMTSKLSGGSVEIFDLDNPAPSQGVPVAPVARDYAGIPMTTDPRVTVYPVDGAGGTYPGQGALYPSEKTWPNSILPVGTASAMTPPPQGWDDERIVDGALAPRVGQNVSSVFFPYGSARLDGANKGALRNVAETAKFAPVERVSIEGHASARAQTADPVKAKILNLKESMNRAQTVSENLIENGVPPEKIKTVAWGDTKPVGSEAAQRRVDIVTGYGAQ